MSKTIFKKKTTFVPGFEPGTASAIAKRHVTAATGPVTVAVGKVYKVFLPWAGVIQSNQQWVTINGAGNAFRVLDAPSSIIVKTEISGEQIYHEKQGQGFHGNFTTLQLQINVKTAVPGSYYTSAVPPLPGIYVTIWFGPSSVIGFFDDRIQRARNNYENLFACGVNNGVTGFAVTGAGTFQEVQLQPNAAYGLPLQQYNVREVWISNLSSTVSIIVCESADVGVLIVPPLTVIRLPLPVINSSVGREGFIDVSPYIIVTTNGAGANCLFSLLMETSSLDYSIPS